jgi:hypothetical protein
MESVSRMVIRYPIRYTRSEDRRLMRVKVNALGPDGCRARRHAAAMRPVARDVVHQRIQHRPRHAGAVVVDHHHHGPGPAFGVVDVAGQRHHVAQRARFQPRPAGRRAVLARRRRRPPSTPATGRLMVQLGCKAAGMATFSMLASCQGVMRSLRERPEPLSSTRPASAMPCWASHWRTARSASRGWWLGLRRPSRARPAPGTAGASARCPRSCSGGAAPRPRGGSGAAPAHGSGGRHCSSARPAQVPPRPCHSVRNRRSVSSCRSISCSAVRWVQPRGKAPFSSICVLPAVRASRARVSSRRPSCCRRVRSAPCGC